MKAIASTDFLFKGKMNGIYGFVFCAVGKNFDSVMDLDLNVFSSK